MLVCFGHNSFSQQAHKQSCKSMYFFGFWFLIQKTYRKFPSKLTFTESAPRPIQLISRHVRRFVMCLFVPSCETRNHVDWRFVDKECTTKIAKLRNPLFSAGLGRRKNSFEERKNVFSCIVYSGDTWHMTLDMWKVTQYQFLAYNFGICCFIGATYYPHTSRHSPYHECT